jgi:hypothetical protein
MAGQNHKAENSAKPNMRICFVLMILSSHDSVMIRSLQRCFPHIFPGLDASALLHDSAVLYDGGDSWFAQAVQ